MGFVVITKDQLPPIAGRALLDLLAHLEPLQLGKLPPHQIGEPELFLHPQRHGLKKRWKSRRCVIEVRFEQPLKFHERFVVEGHVVQLVRSQVSFI